MGKKAVGLIFFLILALSFFLRFYQLGKNPPSIDWDEASLGYNAYHLLKTGRDEYGISWPLAIRSFGDYKPPLYTYLSIPSVAIFGLNEFSVRLPSAIFGVLAVVITFFLVKEIFANTSFALLVMFLLGISPWHIQLSRIAFEANIGLFWFITGIWLFIKGAKNGKYLFLSAISFSLSLYSYHSPRLVLPFLLFGFFVIFRKKLLAQKKWLFLSLVVGILAIAPLILVFLKGQGQARFSSVGVFSSSGVLDRSIRQTDQDLSRSFPLPQIFHNRRLIFAIKFLEGYLNHFNFNFLFLRGDGPGRHHAPAMGVLYLFEFPFLLLGFFWLLKKQEARPVFWWFAVAPLASAISTGTPHAVRALLYLPTFQIFTAYGLIMAFKIAKHKVKRAGLFIILIFLIFLLNFFYYLHQYYIHGPIDYAQDWQYGYKQMVSFVKKESVNYDKVIVSNIYDQPYIYFLFYGEDNSWGHINNGLDYLGYDKYEFRRIDWEDDHNLQRVLFVGGPSETPSEKVPIIKEIFFPNGQVAFRIIGL